MNESDLRVDEGIEGARGEYFAIFLVFGLVNNAEVEEG